MPSSAVDTQERPPRASRRCPVCRGSMAGLIDDIRDWEYGVKFESRLIVCNDCGLVTHDPPIQSDQIPGLYPENYLAHTTASASRSVYGRLKQVLRDRTAKTIAQHLPQGGTFLEIGCGNAQLISDLSRLRPDASFMGVDIKRVPLPSIERFEFFHGQLENVGVPSGSAQLIYCSNLIEHVADPRRFLRECHRVLSPNGVMLGVTPDHASIDRLLFRRYWAGYHYPRHTFVFNHDNIRMLLEQEGFVDVNTSGAYSFWYLSLANRFVKLPGTKKRGLPFALVTAAFLPLDALLNRFTTHGSMTFRARRGPPPPPAS